MYTHTYVLLFHNEDKLYVAFPAFILSPYLENAMKSRWNIEARI